jgi:hypothetical protein
VRGDRRGGGKDAAPTARDAIGAMHQPCRGPANQPRPGPYWVPT